LVAPTGEARIELEGQAEALAPGDTLIAPAGPL
jgi:quercetin dioxygenase-like cupin family protein